jgi:glutathione S-transferase
MMRLYMMDQSPYARKVRTFIAERNLTGRIEEVAIVPHDRPAELVALNPLSKVPTLVEEDGTVHVDSLPICLFLDSVGAEPPLIPEHGRERWSVFRHHALAHGIMECTGSRRMLSRMAPDPDRIAQIERHSRATKSLLDHFETAIGEISARVSLDTLTLGCALGHLDLRFPDEDWRQTRPKLADWHASFSMRLCMRATAPKD